MSVKVTSGANSFRAQNLIGQTIGQVRANQSIKELLSLAGGETAEVKTVDNGPFAAKPDSYTLADDDELRFTKPAGTKGN